MGRKTMIIVSDDNDFIVSARTLCGAKGGTCKVYSTAEWSQESGQPGFLNSVTGESPLVAGNQTVEGAKILPFPGNGQMSTNRSTSSSQKVHTINELESVAIENAIHNFKGNLTEAAKALGIGRATLYRKVKQYGIDPSPARKKRYAA